MRIPTLYLRGLVLVPLLAAACSHQAPGLKAAAGPEVELWLTDPAAGVLFQKQPAAPRFGEPAAGAADITLYPAKTYQTMDGFGYTLTGGSARLINSLKREDGDALLRELFLPEGGGIGVSYLRVSLGASDLDDRVFSYDDLPPGQKDPELAAFSLAPDREHLIPVLKRILALNPDIKILASPWSAPAWMKALPTTVGSSLKPSNFPVYAAYFVKYVQGMRAEGINIDAVTVQNEPLNPDNNPSMVMPPAKQAQFVRDHLGPAFAKAGLKTKIIIYDHNCDEPGYPVSILDDPEARRYIDGSAFHLYDGGVAAMTRVREAHPDKNIYFTEQWVGAPGDLAGDFKWHVGEVLIGASRNWAKTVLEWNLASDPAYGPHTPGGCDACLGAVTIGEGIQRNPAYYVIAHAARFVRPGSVRIDSDSPAGLPNAAFKTPSGRTALIVLNSGETARTFGVAWGGKRFTASLAAGAAGTYVW